jgi:hypothetical protein
VSSAPSSAGLAASSTSKMASPWRVSQLCGFARQDRASGRIVHRGPNVGCVAAGGIRGGRPLARLPTCRHTELPGGPETCCPRFGPA